MTVIYFTWNTEVYVLYMKIMVLVLVGVRVPTNHTNGWITMKPFFVPRTLGQVWLLLGWRHPQLHLLASTARTVLNGFLQSRELIVTLWSLCPYMILSALMPVPTLSSKVKMCSTWNIIHVCHIKCLESKVFVLFCSWNKSCYMWRWYKMQLATG